jgi:hypothetical protein
MKYIIQNGIDGFGHQLEGLWNCLILHNVHELYFDGHSYINKKFQFEHVDESQTIILKEYLIKVVKSFIHDYNSTQINKFRNIVNAHEVWKIPSNSSEDTLYLLDNVFFYKRLFTEKEHIEKINENISHMKNYVMNESLPSNRLHENNVVIHVRMGDALYNGRYDSIMSLNRQLLEIIKILNIQYPGYNYYIHSDGYPEDILNEILKNTNCFFFNKETPVMDTLSDFIYSKILICGNSSLSKVCSFFGKKQLILVCDDNDHSMPDDNVYTVSEYLQNNIN